MAVLRGVSVVDSRLRQRFAVDKFKNEEPRSVFRLLDSIEFVRTDSRHSSETHLIGTDDDLSAENLLDIGGKDIVVCAAASTDLMAEDEGFDPRLSSHLADFLRSGVRFANMTGDAFRVVIDRRGVPSIRRSKDFADKYIDAARKFDKVFRKGGVS